jgi:hypothetical protein
MHHYRPDNISVVQQHLLQIYVYTHTHTTGRSFFVFVFYFPFPFSVVFVLGFFDFLLYDNQGNNIRIGWDTPN